jgi:hypothetical protein
VLAVGARVADYVEDAGQPVDELMATPSSTAGITPLVQEIIMVIEEWHFRQNVDHFMLFYNDYISGCQLSSLQGSTAACKSGLAQGSCPQEMGFQIAAYFPDGLP